MDYSTISTKTDYTETDELTNGEISERYYLLKKQYENLSSCYDTTKQELHDVRRSYQTALDVQSHLTAELESHLANEQRRQAEQNARITSLQEEISALRTERSQIIDRHASESKKMEDEIRNLNLELSCKVSRDSPECDNSEFEDLRAALTSAVDESQSAKAALEEARAEIMSWRLKTEEVVREMAEMQEAAEVRREEAKAAAEREAAAIADLAEARAMLHQYSEPQDLQPHATKGNSIFAEVEDKRQEMAKTLIQMKQTNSRLRRELANKQAELEVLLHEKLTIWEQQAGTAAHCDRELLESYEERVTQLEGVCERQRRELSRWFSKQSDPGAQGCLPVVLEHLKSECEQLRAEVLSRGAAQLASAAQVRELRRKIALLTANGAKQPIYSPPNTNVEDNKVDIAVTKISMGQVKKLTPEDVKKKVSFN